MMEFAPKMTLVVAKGNDFIPRAIFLHVTKSHAILLLLPMTFTRTFAIFLISRVLTFDSSFTQRKFMLFVLHQ